MTLDNVSLSVCSSSSWPCPWQKVSTAGNHGRFSKSPLPSWDTQTTTTLGTQHVTCCVMPGVYAFTKPLCLCANLQWVPRQHLMSNDRVQQLWQTQRDVGTVVRVRVRSSPFFKARQNLFNIAEVVLNVRKQRLGPQHDISWRGGREWRRVSEREATNGSVIQPHICFYGRTPNSIKATFLQYRD